jgi:hypothetical protein
MEASPLDDAASDPQDSPAAQAAAAAAGARLWRRMGRLVGRLRKIGTYLTEQMGEVADWRERRGVSEGSFDLDLGWALVSRAAKWTRALRARMRAVAAEIRAEVGPAPRRGFGPAREYRGPRVTSPNADLLREESHDFIDGLSTGEVTAQICADLTDAAALLRATKAGKVVARIAKAARQVFGGPDETWTKMPEPRRRVRATPAELAAWRELLAAPPVPPAPPAQPAPPAPPAPGTG